MNLFANHFFVEVFDSKEDVLNEAPYTQCFHLDGEQLEPFLKMCKENSKYVKVEIDYNEEEDNGKKTN